MYFTYFMDVMGKYRYVNIYKTVHYNTLADIAPGSEKLVYTDILI